MRNKRLRGSEGEWVQALGTNFTSRVASVRAWNAFQDYFSAAVPKRIAAAVEHSSDFGHFSVLVMAHMDTPWSVRDIICILVPLHAPPRSLWEHSPV